MDDKYTFDEFEVTTALKYAKQVAKEKYDDALETVLTVAFSDLRNLPTLRFPKEKTIILKEYVEKWVNAYFKAFDNRPSQRVGNESSTHSDPIIKTILGARIQGLEDLDRLEAAHAMMMTIENIVGDLLEEYLCEKLAEDGWFCCWGSTLDAIDFCKKGGSLLQVKNSDNSENSSSSRVRNGTTIKKWHRRNSRRENSFNWKALNEMVGREDLSEKDFQLFVNKVIRKNEAAIFVSDDNPLNG